MSPADTRVVSMQELLDQPLSLDLTMLSALAPGRSARDVALISDINEITAIAPDTIVVLNAHVSRGSWMIAAALRYAWERNAAALVIPHRSLNASALQLAERLQVALFSSLEDPTRVALSLSGALGFARARLVSSPHRLAQRVEECDDVTEILELASTWLEGARVSLESAGATVRSAPARGESRGRSSEALAKLGAPGAPGGDGLRAESPNRVAVAVGTSKQTGALLVTEVSAIHRDHAVAVLRACTTKLRALLAETQLATLQHSLLPLSIALLTDESAEVSLRPPRVPPPSWVANGEFVAVCLRSPHAARYSAAVHHLWIAEFRGYPLIAIAEGWLAFIPLGRKDVGAADRVRSRLTGLDAIDIRAGVSGAHTGESEVAASVREAWIAARVAGDSDAGTVLDYRDLPTALLARLLEPRVARELLALRYPGLAADPQRSELIEMFIAYAAHYGSATSVAEAFGIHRNTVRQRLTRLEELGVPVADPREMLGLHVLLSAAQGHPAPRTGELS